MKRNFLLYVILLLLFIYIDACMPIPNIQNSIKIEFYKNGIIFKNIFYKSPVTITYFGIRNYDKSLGNYKIFLVGKGFLRRKIDNNEFILSSDDGYKTDFKTNTYYYYIMEISAGNTGGKIEGSFMIIYTENPNAEFKVDYENTKYLRILQNNEPDKVHF